MKYAVSWMNFFDNDLKICTVHGAANPIEALVMGVSGMSGAVDDPWLLAFLDEIPSQDGYDARIAEIQEEFFNVDQLVSEPLLIVDE